MKIEWIKYSEQKPKIGQLVAVYRDIESRQIFITVWNIEDEVYADWNAVTHWTPMSYPSI